MQKLKKIYFILTYVFFILPPFIWGLVALYYNGSRTIVHIISLYVNLIVLAFLAIGAVLLIYKKKLHAPSPLETKYLLFGLVGNVVVYFYTFQNMMHLQNIVTIYLILLIVLIVHYYLISQKITVWELWILLPIFLFVDTLHLLISGCGFTVLSYCNTSNTHSIWLQFLYVIVLLPSLGYYGYKIYLYKRRDFYGVINLVLILLLGFFMQEFFEIDEKIMGTLSIAAIFFVVLDFIVSIVNKTYSSRILLYYIRTATLLFIFSMIAEDRFFYGEGTKDILIIMVVVTYVSLGVNILKSLLHVQEEKQVDVFQHLDIVVCTPKLKERIKIEYGDIQYNHILLEDNAYTLVALENQQIVGFISTYIKPLTKPLEELQEAYIHIIEVQEASRKQGIASLLVQKTIDYFKHKDVIQIRGWSSTDKVEAIHLWHKLQFNLSPATIWHESAKVAVEGYYFVKQL